MPEVPIELQIAASKSMANRTLCLLSYTEKFDSLKNTVIGRSDSGDVVALANCLERLVAGESVFEIGEGAAPLRFFIMKLLRRAGSYQVRMHPSLAKRPHSEMIKIVRDLGGKIEIEGELIHMDSAGFSGASIGIDNSTSSQNISGLLLNSVDLSSDLRIQWRSQLVSKPYIDLTLELLKHSGIQTIVSENSILVPQKQKIKEISLLLEPDMSSAFAVGACFVAAQKSLMFLDFPQKSTQADFVFLSILEKMGVSFRYQDGNCVLEAHNKDLCSLDFEIGNCPDLFPVLVCLLAGSKGASIISGAAHLRFKESDRILGVERILTEVGRAFESREDGIYLPAVGRCFLNQKVELSCQGDHRLAFAGAVIASFGIEVTLDDPRVVVKSYSGFFKDLKKGGIDVGCS